MAMPSLLAAAITSWSRTEPPGWITAVAPAFPASSTPSGKGKNASDATTLPTSGSLVGRGLDHRDFHRVDAAHLPGADADRLPFAREHNRIGLHMLGHNPAEEHGAPLGVGGSALGDNFQSRVAQLVAIGLLHQRAAGDEFEFERFRRGPGRHFEKAQVFLRGERVQGRRIVAGRDNAFDEQLRDLFGRRGVNRAIERQHAAIGGHGIAGERLDVSFAQRFLLGRAARVVVLDDGDAGR